MCFALPNPALLVKDGAALESMCSRTQVFGKRLNSHRLYCCTVASVQLCFGGTGGLNALLPRPSLHQVLPVQDHAPADRFS